MARKASNSRTPTPYEILAKRVQQQILSPLSQAERRALIQRNPEDDQSAWEQLLNELSQEESVKMTRRDDGAVHLTWAAPTPY